MGYYKCRNCGSSMDANKQCSCGTRDKPIPEKYADGIKVESTEKGRNPHNVHITTASPHNYIYNKMRKEIYNKLCKKTATGK